MGSDDCSAPATSTDIEHPFSEHHWEVNFLQHNLGSQTFRGEMVLGSWDEKPFSLIFTHSWV
ncbi:hypothetical protein C8R43DRAFT_882280 [Mycena crocata]|nr:hypothetical protein C8R43DRAFT_882280 [Mycena crocata]